MKKNKQITAIAAVVIIYIVILFVCNIVENGITSLKPSLTKNNTFKIISSTENKDIENILMQYASKNDIDLQIDYAGTIEIMEKLNNGEKYDAVWCSNSIWLDMLDSHIKRTNSK